MDILLDIALLNINVKMFTITNRNKWKKTIAKSIIITTLPLRSLYSLSTLLKTDPQRT